MWPFLLAQVWTCYPISFFSFCNLIQFWMIKITQNSITISQNNKVNSKKSQSSRAFQYYKEFTSICLKILVLIFLNFLWKNDWIFNNSRTINPNNMESPSYNPYSQKAFQLYQLCNGRHLVWVISTWQTKQTTFFNR